MKAIYFETDEEVTSVIDRLQKVKDSEVALIFPRRSVVVRSIVNLKLIKRQAEIFGKKITIVTADEIGFNLAKRANLSVAKEISKDKKGKIEIIKEEVKEEPKEDKEEFLRELKTKKDKKDVSIFDVIPSSKEKEKDLSEKKTGIRYSEKGKVASKKVVFFSLSSLKFIFVFLAIAFIITGVIAFIILPRATIRIFPKTEMFSEKFEIIVDKDGQSVDLDKGILPGQIKTFERKGEKEKFQATGEKNKGKKAKGEIIVYNKFSSDPQTLPASTIFESQGKKFYSLSEVTIPGAQIKGGKTVAGQAKVLVEAEEPGEEYNLSPASFNIQSIAVEKQKDIFGKSVKEFSGGTTEMIKVVSEEDIKNAKEKLFQETTAKLLEELSNSLPSNELFIKGSEKKEIINVETEAEPDKEVSEFEMAVNVKITLMLFNKKDFKDLIFYQIDKKLSSEKFVLNDDINSGIKFNPVDFNVQLGKLRTEILVEKTVAWRFDEKSVENSVTGKSSQEARNILLQNQNIKDVEVNLWPFWVEKVPSNEEKINLILDTSKITGKIK